MTTRHTVEMGGQTISWLQSGRGRTVILLHGFPLHAAMWEPLHATTPHGWTLITPDLRNFGESRGTPALSIDDHANDVLALLRHLGCEDAVIGGLSMGGYVTLAVHRLAPQRCRALILADTRAEPDTDEAKANRVRLQATGRERGPDAVLQAMLPKLVGPGGAGGRHRAGAAQGDRQDQHPRGHRRRPRGPEDAAGRRARPGRDRVSDAGHRRRGRRPDPAVRGRNPP